MVTNKSEYAAVPSAPVGTSSKPGVGARLLLVAISLLLVFSLIEFPAFIDVIDYRTVLARGRGWAQNTMDDPELIFIRRPYAHFKGQARGGNITQAYSIPESDMLRYEWDDRDDHNGFRNDVDLKRADIAVIGDSFIEGITVPAPQLATSLLADLQHQVVANLAQSAYGPQQELVVLKRYALPLRPHSIVWAFSEGSDLGDVRWYDNFIRHRPDIWHAFWDRSFTKNVLHRFSKRHSLPPGIRREGVLKRPTSGFHAVYFSDPSLPLSANDLGALNETAQILSIAQKLSAAQGARFIFVFIPTKFRVLHGFCTFPDGSECRSWQLNDLPERLRKLVASISPEIGYIDLTPDLVKAAADGKIPYYPDDDHWSPEGHMVAGTVISNYLDSSRK